MQKLGFGLMRLPVKGKIPTMIDIAQVEKMIDLFIQRGFTYFDTAYIYHGMRSEPAARKALVERYDRSAFTLATKLPMVPVLLRSYDDQVKLFEKQLEKCGVDFFDYYLIHSLTSRNIDLANRLSAFDFVQREKDKGRMKNIGFSFHDKADLLDKILTEHPEVDFVQLQINYLDWENEGIQSCKCYETAVKHNKKVIVMEPVKGGTLANVPAGAQKLFSGYNPGASAASWAIRYAASLENVLTVLSGMSTMAQVEDNTAYMSDFKPLNGDERAIIADALKIIKGTVNIPCTACGYCIDGCPKKIAIPDYFALYNARNSSKKHSFSTKHIYYKNLTRKGGKPSDCIGCRQCESICPQHLDITGYLKDVACAFGK